MKLFSAEQIKYWDFKTTQQQGISSLDLMERAAERCVAWLIENGFGKSPFALFCGKGNNGGDGLAIARLLHQKGVGVEVYILEFGKMGSDDFQVNLERLHSFPVPMHYIQPGVAFSEIAPSLIVIDALFGAGLNKPLEGLSAQLVEHINESKATVISIDVPSGLFLTQSSKGYPVVEATYTLTFQTYKLGLLLAENAQATGQVQVLDIGLDKAFYEAETCAFETLDFSFVRSLYRSRSRFAHKGSFGHAMIIGGSYGKMGAVLLSASACTRSGCGLTTVFIPGCGYTILQTALPEAMTLTDSNTDYITDLSAVSIENYAAIGVGPGLGTASATQQAMVHLLKSSRPLVVDADGLNCLSHTPERLQQLPPYSILTPHPKEFDRLFGESLNEVERIHKAVIQAQSLSIVIVLKGHHTLIALPDGKAYFNMTGNAGMAKGGSGDVLTGILTSLLAQGYIAQEAALFGVFLHGLAGDFAAEQLTQETMLASDLVHSLTAAFRHIQNPLAD